MTARPDAQTAAEDLLITVECLDAAGQQARCPMRYPVSADPHLVKLIATDGDGNSGAPRPRRWHQLRRRVIAARDCPGFCYLTIRIFDDDEDDGERSCEAAPRFHPKTTAIALGKKSRPGVSPLIPGKEQ